MSQKNRSKRVLVIGFACLTGCGVQPASVVDESTSDSARKGTIQCPDGTVVAWNKTCPSTGSVVSTAVGSASTASPAVYDTSIGTGVDAQGFAMLPLRSGANRFFVNAEIGADSNGCSNAKLPARPLKTLAAAVSCVTNGLGDQVLLAEGTKYAETVPWLAFKGGFSSQYPTVIQSYDPADPLSETKYGRGDQRGSRPVLTVPQSQVGNGIYSYFAIRGLDFNPGNVPGPNLAFVGQANYVLIENNIFRFTGVTFDKGDKSQAIHHIIRHNSLFGQWSTNGRTGGLYDAGTDGITVEDNVFWHNGWKIGASRDDDFSIGGATVFSHPFYLQTNTSSIVRRNLTMDGAGDGGTARGDILFTENVSIDNPACIGLGGGPSYDSDRPNGVSIEASYNVCLGDADVTSSHQMGWGITTSNGKSGSSAHHNLLVSTRNPSGQNVVGLSNWAAFNQPSYMTFNNNLLYLWAAPGSTYYATGGAFPAQAHTTYDNNIWDDPSSGTNKNNAGMQFPAPYTRTSIFSFLGCADKAACAARMIETPERSWGKEVRVSIFNGYNF